MTQIEVIEKTAEAAPYEVQTDNLLDNEVIGTLRYIGVWDTDQDGEIWVEIESEKGCFSGFIKEVK